MATTRRSFVVHVYADGPCTVEDVRTGKALATEGLAAVGDRIAALLSVDGDADAAPGAQRTGPDRRRLTPGSVDLAGEDAGLEA
jgi:hypothetical protein